MEGLNTKIPISRQEKHYRRKRKFELSSPPGILRGVWLNRQRPFLKQAVHFREESSAQRSPRPTANKLIPKKCNIFASEWMNLPDPRQFGRVRTWGKDEDLNSLLPANDDSFREHALLGILVGNRLAKNLTSWNLHT